MSTPKKPTSASKKPAPGSGRSSSRKPLVYGAVIVLAAGLLGFASYKATAPGGSSEETSATGPAAEVSADAQAGVYPELAKLARRDAGDKLAVGRADAPVVLIEYADFKCGYCGKFARDTEPELIEEYVEKGTLRIEWRNFPIFGEESENAARGAWAAGQQDRFWEFHAAAYAEGAKEKGFSKDRVKALAREAGVKDLARFMKDLDGEGARAAVAKDQEQAYGIGATSTPSFLINGRPIAGAQPKETFTRAIEAAAEQARTTGTEGATGSEGATRSEGSGDAEGSAK
ncbi:MULTISPECIES: DsbA family protein [unclassified Streptomyces]|uniref:DsbA family protein n=1 Tax=unclassified Streptomyces TaxID=2593676 RepID=UPI000823EEAA|nr:MULTISPECIES: DsbA family protein [unclassified Streptomyces]MYU01043.1 thioredoxin domain-containing protein [Streptomyces sp. SID8350]SCK48910.1 Protein-disulfide isomerase [Streptomyces sp. AmelKG-D3]